MTDTPQPAATQPRHSTLAGPTDIQDDTVRREAKKAAVWIGMAALAALVVFFAQPLLVIFGGVVFAAMIDGGARLLGRVLPIRRSFRVAIVLILTVIQLRLSKRWVYYEGEVT